MQDDDNTEEKQRWFAIMERASEIADANGVIVVVCGRMRKRLPWGMRHIHKVAHRIIISDAVAPEYCIAIRPR